MNSVFFDASGKRKKIFKTLVILIGVVLILGFFVLIASIILKPEVSGSGYFHGIVHRFGMKKHVLTSVNSSTGMKSDELANLMHSGALADGKSFIIHAF